MAKVDWGLDSEIVNAQDRIFTWMVNEGYTRDTGVLTLNRYYGTDWSEAFENWWDEGDD
jgi:hypothetical protein